MLSLGQASSAKALVTSTLGKMASPEQESKETPNRIKKVACMRQGAIGCIVDCSLAGLTSCGKNQQRRVRHQNAP